MEAGEYEGELHSVHDSSATYMWGYCGATSPDVAIQSGNGDTFSTTAQPTLLSSQSHEVQPVMAMTRKRGIGVTSVTTRRPALMRTCQSLALFVMQLNMLFEITACSMHEKKC
eukprot:TRINITY_DN7555_c0_g1_i2.p1 TRINITY_DN7555_c0_g1~~TRINITY_DN7555_c0_g1_i2.p1  ORF type:complete len:113 (+),score=2.47 TRINITY_DN7555_c0_g1_i2:928-1266(+)